MGKRVLKAIGIWCLGTVLLAQLALCGQAGSSKNSSKTVYAATEKKDEKKTRKTTEDEKTEKTAARETATEETEEKESSSYGIDEEIQRSSKQLQELETERKQLEEDLKQLEKKKKNILGVIEELDKKLDRIAAKIDSNKKAVTEKKEEIKELRGQKEETQQQKNMQYDTMKKRIKYMYENGQGGYVELLLGAESLSEFFNWSEYVYKVSDYDRNIFKKYQEVCDRLAKEEKQLDEELGKLEELRQDLQFRRDSTKLLADEKEKQLKKYQKKIKGTGAALDSTANALKAQEEELERLLEARRKQIEEENKASADETENNSEASASGYQWPLPVPGKITSYFGYREAPTAGASTYHRGIDIAVPTGTAVLAAKEGTVVTATYSASAGYYVAVYHGGGTYTYYMHCTALCVEVGSKVKAGQMLALSGSTGISTGPHLHFAVYADGDYVNPLIYAQQR